MFNVSVLGNLHMESKLQSITEADNSKGSYSLKKNMSFNLHKDFHIIFLSCLSISHLNFGISMSIYEGFFVWS
jgi:hypothetical protein